MQYSLSNRLSSNVSGIDPDARLYIAAVEAVLPGNNIATALPNAVNPKRIISDFFKAEKAANRWALHKRIYLPIYANAAASAVDMVSRTSGEFTLSGVTHAAGYVQGNGTTGYFDLKASPSGLALTNSNGAIIALSTQADSRSDLRALMGCYQSGTQDFLLGSGSATSLRFDAFDVSTGSKAATLARASHTGIISAVRSAGGWDVRRRTTSGVTSLVSVAGSASGTVPTLNIYGMGIAVSGGLDAANNGRFGAFCVTSGISIADTDACTSNMKTLWESLTGLALP